MDINQIISRAKNIILSPVTEWEVIKTEAKPSNDILLNYAVPFVVLVGVCKIVGSLLFHMSYFSLTFSLLSAIVAIIVPLGTLYISAWIINELASSFGSQKNFEAAFRLTAYAFTASYLASAAAALLPIIGISTILSLCGLYSFYILYTGFTPMMATPEDKKVGYFVVSLLVIIVAMVILTLVLGLMLFGGGAGISMMK
jgi:hypothetical protein